MRDGHNFELHYEFERVFHVWDLVCDFWQLCNSIAQRLGAQTGIVALFDIAT